MMTMQKNKWDFVYDEQFEDPWGCNSAGILSDGDRFLFWHAFPVNEIDRVETCRIYDSFWRMYNDDDPECEYPWTAENDSLLVACLNNLEDPNNYRGENSPIRILKFNEEE